LSCPQSFMNRSGVAVQYLKDYYRPEAANIMIVHDDIDLDLGHVRLVRGGGAGGHHGVESVICHLGTKAFNRARIGIGRPRYNEPVEDFVLSPLYEDQQIRIKEALHVVAEAIEWFLLEGIESAMNRFNSLLIWEKGAEG
jgi:PTH1 family peptidyl-tRNA hydrolase